ncbi:MAG TPA: flagellar hook-associated protein FlgK [Methylomirabilota bacterium]|nr:flagellar hook-associated protein FlgK [Methylomirabilota bacterium]
MAGLFDTLQLGSRSMQAQRHGLDVAGHNLGNVNTPGYARQRVALAEVGGVSSSVGFLGAGVDAVGVAAIRDAALETQIQLETGISGSLSAQEKALYQALAALNESLNTNAASAAEITNGLTKKIGDLFSSFQTLSTSPLSPADRQNVLVAAEALALEFRNVSARLDRVDGALAQLAGNEVETVNQLLDEVSGINDRIVQAESRTNTPAHELRGQLQQKLGELAGHIPFTLSTPAVGGIALTVDGHTLIAPAQQPQKLALVTSNNTVAIGISGQPDALTLSSGSLHGLLETRSTTLTALRADIDLLASSLISSVNQAHSNGFAPDGSTGRAFFAGTTAADIRVSETLTANPSLLQTSGAQANASDNATALGLAQLASTPVQGLNNQTFASFYGGVVSGLGATLKGAREQLATQRAVEGMLANQREAISGVSIDEELTDMMKFQKAFQASARFVSVADELLDAVINLT